MYSLQPIRSQEDYKASLKEIERLFEAPQGTPEFDRLEILVTLVEAYENKHEPIVIPDPIEAILYYLESRGLTQQHLEAVIGSSGDLMKMENNQELEDELRPEYTFSKMKGGVRGKYVERYKAGTNVVLLDPDVAQAFRTSNAVNEALRRLMQIGQRQNPNNALEPTERL